MTRDKFTDFTAQLGGPIVKDKLWFFASYGNQRDYYWDVGVDSSNALDRRARRRTDRYFGKLNWQINPKHKLVGTFHLDDKDDDDGLDANSAPETACDAHAPRRRRPASATRASSPTRRCWRCATRASTAT